MAVAYCGLGVQEFLDLTPAEFAPILKACHTARETEIRSRYESMRIQTMFLINAHLKKSQRLWDADKFMPLPWDKQADDDEDFVMPKIDKEAFKAFINGTKDDCSAKPGDQHANC
jgi:hypothetical protein